MSRGSCWPTSPFRQLARAAERLRDRGAATGDTPRLLQRGRLPARAARRLPRAADSVSEHLEEYGVSVDIVFEVDQLRAAHAAHRGAARLRARRPSRRRELLRLIAGAGAAWREERRGVRALLARHYSLLARKVAERSAETGEHYITRDRAEYRDMLRAAAGGGAVIAGTTFVKFASGARR